MADPVYGLSGPGGGAGSTMLRVLSNSQIEERDEQVRRGLLNIPNRPVAASQLAEYVKKRFEEAEEAKRKTGVTEKLIDAARRRRGEYDATTLAKIRKVGGSELFSKDTEVKCNAAEAIITDVMMPYGDKMWGVKPTPIPDLPEGLRLQAVDAVMREVAREVLASGQMPRPEQTYELAQRLRDELEHELKKEAEYRAERCHTVMHDQMTEMHFQAKFKQFVSHVVTFGTGIIKGPIFCMRPHMVWEDGEYVKRIVEGQKAFVVHPLNFFPCPASTDTKDGYNIERMQVSGPSLVAMKDTAYYQANEIDKLLLEHPNGYYEQLPTDQERSDLEYQEDPTMNVGSLYDVKDYWGPVPGAKLKEWGMSWARDKEFYDTEVLRCGNRILKVMPYWDPLGRPVYHKSNYKPVVGAFWGQGIPHLIKDKQDIANNCIRSIANNMAFSSGPMVAIDTTKLPPGTDIETLHPWQLFLFEAMPGQTGEFIKFFQPDSHCAELMKIYADAVRGMDDESGIPAYQYGNEKVAGAGRTAHGLSMLMNASARGIKEAMAEMDLKVIAPFVEMLFTWNMLFNPDTSIRGDAQIVTYGTSRMLMEDMKHERFGLFMQETANPVDLQIIGAHGRAKMLRRRAEMLDAGLDDVVPDEREIEQVQQMQDLAAAQQPDQGGRNTLGTPAKESNTMAA